MYLALPLNQIAFMLMVSSVYIRLKNAGFQNFTERTSGRPYNRNLGTIKCIHCCPPYTQDISSATLALVNLNMEKQIKTQQKTRERQRKTAKTNSNNLKKKAKSTTIPKQQEHHTTSKQQHRKRGTTHNSDKSPQ